MAFGDIATGGLGGPGCVHAQVSYRSVFSPRLFRALEALHPCTGLLPVGFASVTADLPRCRSPVSFWGLWVFIGLGWGEPSTCLLFSQALTGPRAMWVNLDWGGGDLHCWGAQRARVRVPTCGIQAGSHSPVTSGLVDKGWGAAGAVDLQWVGGGHPGTQSLVPACTGVSRSQPEALSSGSPRERQAHPG